IVDKDMSSESRAIISKLQGSEFFEIKYSTLSEEEAEDHLHANRCDLVLKIPHDFSAELQKEKHAKVMVLANAINATTAQLSWAYLNALLMDYNIELIKQSVHSNPPAISPSIKIENRFWYNSSLNYKYYMLPGVLVILVTAIGLLLAGLNVVKEKEMGTIEQINVTPIRKYQFLVAKLVPFLIIGLIDMAFGLLLGKIFFNIPFEGSLLLLFGYTTLYLIAVLGMTLFFSTISGTQQQYIFVVFFILLIFMLMSGIFTPAESMPLWAQKFNIINPAAYFMRVIRMVMLKGSGLHDIIADVRGIIIIGVTTLSLAILAYRKTA
ncbi:MAG: ABC transporter permease, partial [Bacteroidales bacterium]|nr:ABC transporter permease [Bacteroidales bacterium]